MKEEKHVFQVKGRRLIGLWLYGGFFRAVHWKIEGSEELFEELPKRLFQMDFGPTNAWREERFTVPVGAVALEITAEGDDMEFRDVEDPASAYSSPGTGAGGMRDAKQHRKALLRLRRATWLVSLADLDEGEFLYHPMRVVIFALLGRFGYRLVSAADLKELREAMKEEYDTSGEKHARS